MKRVLITTVATCLVLALGFYVYYATWQKTPDIDVMKVGFVYENDGSSPYTYNFLIAQGMLEQRLEGQVEVFSRSNVLENETEDPLRELVREGCGIIFAITESDQVMAVAEDCPETQFCQISRFDADGVALPENYHTFNAEISGARYIGGVAAGMKLRELIDAGELTADEALVGFVGANAGSETLSGCTAFLLGVRSVAPEARLMVKTTGAWCRYNRDLAAAEALIDAGCRVIAQNTHTIAPAVACEAADKPVYLIGSDQSTIDIAPGSTLVSVRANWTPYITGAVEAVMNGKRIERYVAGSDNGNDLWAGFDLDWTQVLEVNAMVAAEGTEEQLDRVKDQLSRGRLNVFKGDYTGVDPKHPEDTIDLKDGYAENARSSYPTFHYILDGCVEILE